MAILLAFVVLRKFGRIDDILSALSACVGQPTSTPAHKCDILSLQVQLLLSIDTFSATRAKSLIIFPVIL
jgi:hypothetical protein